MLRSSRTDRRFRGIHCKSWARLASRTANVYSLFAEEEILTASVLDFDDIQSGVFRPRPTPYAATYLVFRIDDRKAGRELMRRLCEVVASAAHPTSPAGDTWISAALSFQGLKALGVPQASLDSFSPEFHQGIAA